MCSKKCGRIIFVASLPVTLAALSAGPQRCWLAGDHEPAGRRSWHFDRTMAPSRASKRRDVQRLGWPFCLGPAPKQAAAGVSIARSPHPAGMVRVLSAHVLTLGEASVAAVGGFRCAGETCSCRRLEAAAVVADPLWAECILRLKSSLQ